MESFTIFPAIDLRGGKVVRLAQGDPSRQTAYDDDPAAAARRWLDQGAGWLHVIDLDAAIGINHPANQKTGWHGESANQRTLKDILAIAGTLAARVEFGGGMRDRDAIRGAFDLGVSRVFLGTAAILDPELMKWAIERFGPEAIAGDIGARDGRVSIRGWQEATPLSVMEAGRRFRSLGLEWCVLTDVSRDGAGRGLNVDAAVELQEATGMKIVASGGVSSLEDIRRAREAGLAGVIVGRALYDGRLSLPECLDAGRKQE